jgi:glyoxylase-like metal-dependent hydrolase (beta-lactamase superfamily II)
MSRSIKDTEYRFVKDGDAFDLGGLKLVVYALPGHTRGSVGLFCPETGDFFSGDVLMYNHNFMYGHGIEWSAAPDKYIHGLFTHKQAGY